VVVNDTNPSASQTATINVVRDNDVPVGADNSVTTLENVPWTFASSDFVYNDPDADAFAGIQVLTLPAVGALTAGGVGVNSGQIIGDVTTLVFSPGLNAHGVGYASFMFKVRAASGASSVASYTMTINVSKLNHPPVANPDVIVRSANEDVKVAVSTLLANDTDPDSDSLTLVSVDSLSAGGASVSLIGQWIHYVHNGGGPDSFTYQISDGHGGSAAGTVTVGIKPADAQSGSVLTIAPANGGIHLQADGIPGVQYTIEYKDNVNDGWSTLGTAVANSVGIYMFDDPAGTLVRIYRSVYY
jgi:hypothetical protein